MKILFTIIVIPILFLLSLFQYSALHHEYIGLGNFIRMNEEVTLTKSVNPKPGEKLKSVSILIWQRRLDGISVFLESPSGIRIELTRSNGKFGYWYKGTTFTDDADTLIYTAQHPFKGAYRPHQYIGWLNQGEIKGKWKLVVKNRHPFSRTGIIAYWKLSFSKNVKPLRSIESSTLPVLVINTNKKKAIGDDKKTKADIFILNNKTINTIADTSNVKSVAVKIKVRGFSSRNLPKKSYSVDLTSIKDTSLFEALNLPPADEWILNGNFMEKSLIRNSLVYHLYKECGYDASTGKHVEVILNGAYIGVYVLQNKIEPSPHFLKDTWSNPNGFMVKIDSPVDRKKGFYTSPKGWNAEHHIYYQYIYPSAKQLKPEQEHFITQKISSFENQLLAKSATSSLDDIIDVKSFVDYFIFEELCKNNDGYNLSCNLYLTKENKIAIGPVWDFDRSLGNSTSGFTRSTEGWKIGVHKHNEYHPTPLWWKTLLGNEQFQNTVVRRWKELSENALSNKNIVYLIDSLSQPLMQVQERNFKTWPVWGISRSNFYTDSGIKNYHDEINDLKQWLITRRSWMNIELLKKEGPVFYHML